MKKERTKEEKAAYYKKLRNRWNEAKRISSNGNSEAYKAIIITHGLNISLTSFIFVKIQMDQLGYEGIPYLDMKTFQGWKYNGFQVKKGEKSQVDGITWLSVGGNNSDNEEEVKEEFMLPRQYHLFHRSQIHSI